MKGLKQEIGLITLVCISIGSMVGSGIFALPAIMGAVAGPSLILAILIAGLITCILAMPYVELGSAFPLTGGPFVFPRMALGDFGGFLMGWGYFFYLVIGTAAILDIFIVYLSFYIPSLAVGETLTATGISIAVIILWLLTLINVFGVKWGGLYSVITTIGKLIPLFLFGLIGLFYLKTDNFTPFMPFGITGVTIAVTLFFWAFTGFETIVVPTEEVKKPSFTIPMAMLLTLVISIFIYMFMATIFVGMIDWHGLHIKINDWQAIGKLPSAFSDIASGLNLPFLAAFITFAAIIATGGSGGSWVLVQGRLPFAMAHDGLFFKYLSAVHPKYKTPAASIIFSSILTTIVLIAIPSFPSVAMIASITAVLPYAAAVLAVPILRKTKPDVLRPFKLPMCSFFATLGFILSTFLIYWATWPWTLAVSIIIIFGYIAYAFIKNRNYEFVRNSWILAYLTGIVIISLLGDPKFSFNNFTPYKPLGILCLPYDLIALAFFALIIYFWAYFANTRKEEEK
jgi:amino acid transporter